MQLLDFFCFCSLLVGSSERGVQPANRMDTANAAQARQEEWETCEASASPTPSTPTPSTPTPSTPTLQDTDSGNHRLDCMCVIVQITFGLERHKLPFDLRRLILTITYNVQIKLR